MPPEQVQPEPAESQEISPEIAQPEEPTEEFGQEPAEVEPGVSEEEAAAMPEMAFSWQASEYVHHHKSMLWYVVLFMAVIVLAALAIWLHYWLEIGVFVIMGVAVAVYARKPPRTLLYELSDEGVHVDGKLYPFSVFRSFSVVPDEEWHSIDLESSKRFNPRLVLLFNTPDLDEIVDHLELHLPREDRDPDLIERITRYLRF